MLAFAAASVPLATSGRTGRRIATIGWTAYGGAVALGALTAGLRFRSGRIGAMTAAGSVATHVTYGAAFVAGFGNPNRPRT
jgi:hypothetical protein